MGSAVFTRRRSLSSVGVLPESIVCSILSQTCCRSLSRIGTMFSRRVRLGFAFGRHGRVALFTLRFLLTGLPCKKLTIELRFLFLCYGDRRRGFVTASRSEHALICGRGRNSIFPRGAALAEIRRRYGGLHQIGWLDRLGT